MGFFGFLGGMASAVGGFVADAAGRLVSGFFGKEKKKDSLPVVVQQIRDDDRVRQAEIDYFHRKEARELEIVKIQELRLKTDLELAKFNAKNEEKALQLREKEVEIAKGLKEQELQLLRQELEDRQKLSAVYLEIIREHNAEEIELKREEIQALFDQQKWPGVLSRDEAERIFVDGQQKARLLMLVPPPDISDDFPLSFRDSLKKEIRNQLKLFLEKYYSLDESLSPVEFYGKYFDRSVFDAEVKQLETILSAVPTAVIYTDITDHEVYFNVRFWGLQDTISLSFEPWNWEETYESLVANGTEEAKSLRVIRQIIVTLHKLYASFLADFYYLNIDPNYEPKLFNLAEEIPEEWSAFIINNLREIKTKYSKLYGEELQLLVELDELKKLDWTLKHTITAGSIVRSIAIHPDGKTFASGSDFLPNDNPLKIWNLETGENITSFSGHSKDVKSVTFNYDGTILASGSSDQTIKLWYSKTGVTFTEHSGYIYSVNFSPNGELLASSSGDNTIKIWNIANNELVCTLTGHEAWVNTVLFLDNNTLISGSYDNTIKVWSLHNQSAIHTISEHTKSITSLTICPQKNMFASGSSDGTVKLWDLNSYQLIASLNNENAVNTIAFSPDGKLLVSAGINSIKFWHLGTKKLIKTLTFTGAIFSIAFSPDGKTLIRGGDDKIIKIWQVNK